MQVINHIVSQWHHYRKSWKLLANTVNLGVPQLVGTVAGTPVGVATGMLSTGGNYTALQDIAVAYAATGTQESTVAVFQNRGTSPQLSFTPTGNFDAGQTNPTAIAVANLSGGAWNDIIVTNNDGRGTISVLQPITAPLTPPSAGTTTATVSVNLTNTNISNLVVTVGLVDLAGVVNNLSLTLIAPNGLGSITLVENQALLGGGAITSRGLPGGTGIGVYGATTTNPGILLGTTFDDNATRNIFDNNGAAPPANGGNSANGSYVGHFRPEDGTLASLINNAGSSLNGPWRLVVRNFSTSAPTGFIEEFQLQFTTGMRASTPEPIAQTLVPGSITKNYLTTAPSTPNGIGPGLVLAEDNTLGPDSPYQGRIYAAYVGYENTKDPNQHTNPTTNTDIFLAYSDNGGQSWVSAGIVNNDAATGDGYSSSSIDSIGAYTSGRTQFQPAIAVDQSTGTLVITWRDARDDAANARVATYITTSIDGGQTFSAQTYANPQYTAMDAITGQTDVLGPESDNQSSGNPQRDATFGYGNQMGLAVLDGQLFPVWAGNFNQSTVNFQSTGNSSGVVTADPLNIWYRPMVIAAGPRIVNSMMGPIAYPSGSNPTISFNVTFDRPVTATTFVPGDVQVFFHNTTNGSSFVPLSVTGVTPVAGSGSGPGNSFGYTQFTVTFNPTPAGAPTPYNYTGTYSYLIAPDNGSGTAISSPIWSYVNGVLRKDDPMDQNADGTPDQNAVTTLLQHPSLTPGDVYAVPTPQPTSLERFYGPVPTGSNYAILQAPFNQNTLPLIVPGPQVLATSVPGGDSGNGNLITDGTTSTLNVTFDRPMRTSAFTPSQVLQIMGPTGSISGPQYFPSNSTGQIIPAATSSTAPGTLSSTLSIPSYNGTFNIADITVQLSAAFPTDSGLTAVLIAPDGKTQVPLFSGVGGKGSNFVNTVFDDAAENLITTGTAPFTGSFKPTGSLSTLLGKTVDTENSFNQWVAGTWTLKLTNSLTGVTGMLDNWSLNITPVISVTPVNPVNGTATQSLFQKPYVVVRLRGRLYRNRSRYFAPVSRRSIN